MAASKMIKTGLGRTRAYVVTHRAPGDVQMLYWLRAEDLRTVQAWTDADTERLGMSKQAFMSDRALLVEGPDGKPIGNEPRPSDLWHCGNGHLRAQATLLRLEGLTTFDAYTIETLSDLFYEAGPAFTQRQIERLDTLGIPF